MENDLPATPSLPLLSRPITYDDKKRAIKNDRAENFPIMSSILKKSFSLTLNRPGSFDLDARRPFRHITRLSNSSASSSPSSFGGDNGNKKKKPLQKQKSCGSGSGRKIKCVLVGDSKTGKSALVRAFLQQGQSITPQYVPTTQDIHYYVKRDEQQSDNEEEENNNINNNKKKKTVVQDASLQICDTGGQEEMDRLRPLCYSHAQMIIICFSVMNPSSFANVTMKWLPEVKRHCKVSEDPENPLKLLLVGTQSDLRSNVSMLLKLMDDGLAPISETQAVRLARKIGALKYVESSSLTRSNVNHIFDLSMTYGDGKILPKHLTALDMETGLHGKILPNLTERKLLFWRRWKNRQNNKSSKMKHEAIFASNLVHLHYRVSASITIPC